MKIEGWAIVEKATGIVLEVILYDGVSEYAVAESNFLVKAPDYVRIGWLYNGDGTFTENV
jgi:hypothetical protein